MIFVFVIICKNSDRTILIVKVVAVGMVVGLTVSVVFFISLIFAFYSVFYDAFSSHYKSQNTDITKEYELAF